MLTLLGIFVFVCLGVKAQLHDELQEVLEHAQEDYKLLGMSIGAFEHQDWILKGEIGVRNADDSEKTQIGPNDSSGEE